MTGNPVRTTNKFTLLLADRRVNTKILVVLATLASVAIGLVLVGVSGMGAINDNAQAIYAQNLRAVNALGDVRSLTMAVRIDVLNLAASLDSASMDKYQAKITEGDENLAAAVAAYRKLSPKEKATTDAYWTAFSGYQKIRDTQLIPAARENDDQAFQRIRDDRAAPLLASAVTALETLQKNETDHAAMASHNATTTYSSSRTTMIVSLLAGLTVALALGLWVSRLITVPLRKVSHVIAGLAEGDLTRTADVDSRDEVGEMAHGLDAALRTLRGTVSTLAGSASSLAGAAEELSAVTSQISAAAEEAATQSVSASAAAEQVSRNVQTVAGGTEQMSASIREIAGTAQEASKIGTQAGQVAATTTTTVAKLGDSSSEIGNVIKMITSIAEQTNLLALNATIEAARAGDAGKGFAVVADEVKQLAQETARATEDISRRIEAIQTDTVDAVAAIGEISTIIEQLGDYQATIASAVEEQTATTNDITRNVAEAAEGSVGIAANLSTVASAAESASSGVTDSQNAAASLARMSAELQQLVGQFRY